MSRSRAIIAQIDAATHMAVCKDLGKLLHGYGCLLCKNIEPRITDLRFLIIIKETIREIHAATISNRFTVISITTYSSQRCTSLPEATPCAASIFLSLHATHPERLYGKISQRKATAFLLNLYNKLALSPSRIITDDEALANKAAKI